MSRIFYCILVLIISFSNTSCSFHRRVAGKKAKSIEHGTGNATDTGVTRVHVDTSTIVNTNNNPKATIINPAAGNENKQLIDFLTPVWNNKLKYSTFLGKAKIHYQGKETDQEFTINFRIRKDSIIWMAVTAMGGMIQAARVCVTHDSFFMINYIDKEVTCLPLTQVAKILPVKVDYTLLQNIILGEPLGVGIITNAISFGGTWSLDIADSSYLQHITYSKDDTTMVNGQIKTLNPDGPNAMIEYGEYDIAEERKISTKRVINIQNGEDIYSIDMKLLNSNFDLHLEYPFTVPKNYKMK